MSIRYGVALTPEPTFTARVYQARQIICGQYASWAAEMQMLHLALADFFQCSDQAVETISEGLSKIAEESRHRVLRFPLLSRSVVTYPDLPGDIHLDFTVSENPKERQQRELNVLHNEVVGLLERTVGVVPDLRFARENYRPRIALMQYADLPLTVFDSAVEFARAVLRDLQVPNSTRAWDLVLVRFESEAAGDDWDNGRWAKDLRWRLLASRSL
jgi:hypothetical protein